jgi:regulator of replication initiation timing
MTSIEQLLAEPVSGPLSQGDAALLIRYREALRELNEAFGRCDSERIRYKDQLATAEGERDDLKAENETLKRQLAYEVEHVSRIGERNRQAMQVLGVPFGHPTEGIVEGAQRVVNERNDLRTRLATARTFLAEQAKSDNPYRREMADFALGVVKRIEKP